MKKMIALMLALMLVASLAACAPETTPSGSTGKPSTGSSGSTKPSESTPPASEPSATKPENDPAINNKGEGALTYKQYMEAEMKSIVTIEAYVQATQSWWEKDGQGVITIYSQDLDGGYFLYEVPCTKEQAEKLVPGTKIRVTGTKSEWSGEVEIMNATSLEILEGTYVAKAQDVTELLSKEEELIKKQNMFVSFTGLVVEKIEYKNGEPGDDIYITFSQGGDEQYTFCVESYLTGPDTNFYKSIADLQPGAVVIVEGFLYWYEGVNTHITNIIGKSR